MTPQRDPAVRTVIDNSKFGQPRKGFKFIRSRLAKLDWRAFISTLSDLAGLINSPYISSEQTDRYAVSAFLKPKFHPNASSLLNSGRYVFLNNFQLALLAQEALRASGTRSANTVNSNALIGELLLAANDLMSVGTAKSATGPTYIRSLIQTLSLSYENDWYRLARYFHLYAELGSPRDSGASTWNIRRRLQDALDIDLDAIFMICFGVVSVIQGISENLLKNPRERIPWSLINPSFWDNTDIPRHIGIRHLRALASSPQHFRKSSEYGKSANVPFDLRYIRTRPLVDVGSDRFAVPSPDFMLDRLTTRLYFDIFDPLSDDKKEEFGGYIGGLVERYIHELLEDTMGKSGTKLARWYSPGEYEREPNVPEGPDAIVVEEGPRGLSLVFLEVKSSRPTAAGMVRGDIGALRRSWRMHLIGSEGQRKAARQLDQSVTDFRESRIRLPGIPSSVEVRIYPVIVTLDSWPLWLENYDDFAAEIAGHGLLKQTNVAPIEVWSCYDIEVAMSLIAQGETLVGLLGAGESRSGTYVPLNKELGLRNVGDGPAMLHKIWERMQARMAKSVNLQNPPA